MPNPGHSKIYSVFIVASLCFGLCTGITQASSPGPETFDRTRSPKLTSEEKQVLPAARLTEDTIFYPVSSISFVYARPHPDHVPPRRLAQTEVTLIKTGMSYLTSAETKDSVRDIHETETVTIPISDIGGSAPVYLSKGTINWIIKRAVQSLTDEYGLAGIYILPHPSDISPYGEDLRSSQDLDLTFLVQTSTVSEIISRPRGPRYLKILRKQNDQSDPVNLPPHDWIRKGSPVKPSTLNTGYDNLLRKDLVDSYIARLSRHPGRYVRAVIGATDTPGEAALEYLVSESKPWVTYAQFTNTGTGNTTKWQKRAGLIHNQISGHDDILSLDYLTAGFDDYNSIQASYDAPLLWERLNRTRIAFDAGYSEFTSTDVGLPGADFTGETVTAGLSLSHNIVQHDELFIDLTGKIQWKDIEVNNEFAQVSGNEIFLKPSLSLDAERKTRRANTTGGLALETNLAGIAGTDSKDIPSLGRTNVASRWVAAKMNARHSFYLEPLIFGDDFRDPSTPETSTLAHEVRLNARGQYVFSEKRVVPQEKFVAGGLYSVRGYPQSVTSGDTGLSGSVEYRLHLPNLLPVKSNPQPTLFGDSFRLHPSQVYGVPDWDLVLKLFSDVGRTINNDNVPGVEDNETLWSMGAGLELQVMKNLRLQVDYGYALSGLDSGNVERGNNEIHFSLSLFY